MFPGADLIMQALLMSNIPVYTAHICASIRLSYLACIYASIRLSQLTYICTYDTCMCCFVSELVLCSIITFICTQNPENEQLMLHEIGGLLHEMVGGAWSDVAVCRAMKDAGFVHSRVTNLAAEADESLQADWEVSMRRIAIEPKHIVCTDETYYVSQPQSGVDV